MIGEQVSKNRRSEGGRMTEENFRQHTLDTFMMIQNHLEDGRLMMKNLDEKIDAHFKIQTMDVSELKEQMKINSAFTRKIARDTSGLVTIYSTGKKTINAVSSGTKKISKFSKIMMPVFALMTAFGMILHGHWPTWQEIVKAIK